MLTDADFKKMLAGEVQAKRMTAAQMNDFLKQKASFDARRTKIYKELQNRIVGFANGQMLVGDTVHEVFESAHTKAPDRLVYFEPIGFDLV